MDNPSVLKARVQAALATGDRYHAFKVWAKECGHWQVDRVTGNFEKFLTTLNEDKS
jgi:hypothetical protein